VREKRRPHYASWVWALHPFLAETNKTPALGATCTQLQLEKASRAQLEKASRAQLEKAFQLRTAPNLAPARF
jgi:hypothetical protein